MTNAATQHAASLRERWQAFRLINPKVRIRDAARELGTTEAELVATGTGIGTTRLRPEFEAILREVEQLGHVMALTRNDSVVHERKGIYLNPSFNPHVGLFVGEDIDLRLFMGPWAFGFAVSEGDKHSLQFFAKDGEAIHKIYLTERSNREAFEALVKKFAAGLQSPELQVETPKEKGYVFEGISAENAKLFRQEWAELRDTHDFFGLLKKFELPRREAMRYAPEGLAYQVSPGTVRLVLQAAAEKALPVMVFVGNQGCIQIHTGTVSKLFEMGPWYNVMDPEFNLHLREDAIAEAWVVIKPTDDGVVTALEVFDAHGEMVVQFFGKRKPGKPELQEWRDLVKANAVRIS
ncbi:hemin-degrading factor [Ravibacter arvi]|uniref:Hemin-degrading factor n=1 Tax=Ravibacter arvi TaxID=2051041 RepID=A0ABP8LSS7_9BACT